VIPVQLYVSSGSQFETGEDLINYATEHPRELTIGVVEVEGGDGFRVGYLADNGAEFLPVVYSKPTERTASLLGGHIDVMMARLNIVEEYIEAGKLRPVLSLTPERVSLLPDVQSLEEVGVTGLPLAQLVSFRGEVVKKGTPENRIRILANAFEKAVQYEAWIEFCKGEGTVASEIYRPAEGFRKFLEDYAASYTTKYNEIAIGLLP